LWLENCPEIIEVRQTFHTKEVFIMKRNLLFRIVLLASLIVFPVLLVNAVPNPNAINWNAERFTFIRSLYVGVLGRQPESEWVVQNWGRQVDYGKPSSRLRIFWLFVNSPEYQASEWARQPKEYNVYRRYIIYGNYYEFVVANRGPGAEYYYVSGPFTFGVAIAVKRYAETFESR